MGVAVQSKYFSVGTDVPWAEAGVGAVATQARVDPSFGLKALGLLRTGMTAPEVLKALAERNLVTATLSVTTLDPDNATRYVAMLRRLLDLGGFHHILYVSHNLDAAALADTQIVVRDGQPEVLRRVA